MTKSIVLTDPFRLFPNPRSPKSPRFFFSEPAKVASDEVGLNMYLLDILEEPGMLLLLLTDAADDFLFIGVKSWTERTASLCGFLPPSGTSTTSCNL